MNQKKKFLKNKKKFKEFKSDDAFYCKIEGYDLDEKDLPMVHLVITWWDQDWDIVLTSSMAKELGE